MYPGHVGSGLGHVVRPFRRLLGVLAQLVAGGHVVIVGLFVLGLGHARVLPSRPASRHPVPVITGTGQWASAETHAVLALYPTPLWKLIRTRNWCL